MPRARFSYLMLPLLATIGCSRVDARLSEADIKSAVLKTQSVKRFGGMTVSVTIELKGAELKRTFPASTGRPPVHGKVVLSAEQQRLFREIVTIISRDQLWKQKDVTVKAVDGGERTFEFEVGKHKGKFTLINAAPKHLHPFIIKTQELISSIEESVLAKSRKQPAPIEGR